MTKIQLLSDTHSGSFLINNSVDFAIHAGDITNHGLKEEIGFPWNNSLKSFKASLKPIYWVPGNHDIGFKQDTIIEGGINILEKTITHNNISIRGISLSVCYNAPYLVKHWDHMTATEIEEFKYFSVFMREYADIIVSHSPPTGEIGSELECGDIGSSCLLEYIEEFQPKLVVCGHVHKPLCRETWIGNTLVINVARISKIIEFEDIIK